MNPNALFIVTSDPRVSHRAAEAIRMAAGISAWKKANITVYLRGAAILALGEWVDDLVHDDDYTRYLPILRDPKHPILVEAGSPYLSELGEATMPFEPITDDVLGSVAAQSQYVLRF